MPEPDLDDLATRFIARTLPHAEWTHLAHLAVGMWHVDRYGVDEALSRMREGIRRLNDSHGTPNTETRGYHETITRAYLSLIHQFLGTCSPSTPRSARFTRMVSTRLAERDALLAFYTRECLMSAEARAGWVEPDLAALNLAGLLGAATGAERTA